MNVLNEKPQKTTQKNHLHKQKKGKLHVYPFHLI